MKDTAQQNKKKKCGLFLWWKDCKKWQKAIMAASLIAVLIVCTFAAVLIAFVKKNFAYNYNEITSVPKELGFDEVKQDDIVNIALFGVDTNSTTSFTGRSDCIMILSLNKSDKKIKLISVMRDSLVTIEKNGKPVYNKINNAYASGGPERAIKTLNQNFKLDISEYATVNFAGMEKIIDAVGGIDIELTAAEAEKVLGKNAKGSYHLNGQEAVLYSRIRSFSTSEGTANDYGRTDRQRYVMELLFNKALTIEKSQYLPLIKALSPNIQTSLTYTEIFNLAVSMLLNSPTFEQTRVPDTKYIMPAPKIKGVGSVVYYDLEFASNIIHAFIYDDITPQSYIEQNGISKNDWYAS